MKRYIMPYRKYLVWSLILNFYSQWLNVFSFLAIIPILNILFKIDTKVYEYQPMELAHLDTDVLMNNASYWIISQTTINHGAFTVLAIMGCILILATLLKTAGHFASSAIMVAQL